MELEGTTKSSSATPWEVYRNHSLELAIQSLLKNLQRWRDYNLLKQTALILKIFLIFKQIWGVYKLSAFLF